VIVLSTDAPLVHRLHSWSGTGWQRRLYGALDDGRTNDPGGHGRDASGRLFYLCARCLQESAAHSGAVTVGVA
jgi:hypothetical protein